MADPQIRVGITATTDAAEVKIAQAYQKIAAASLELQNVQSRHTDILKNYNSSALNAATTTNLLSENLREQTAATEQLTAAKIELKAASQGEVAVQQEVSGAVQKTVSSYYAAQGAARVLEGGIPIRAFEKFISTISGVGPLLQAAFPVIGIVAMVELLVDAGEKLGKFAADAGALGRELGTGWLDGALAQMTSLGKEIKQADEELLKLAGDRDRIREQKQTQDVEQARVQTQVVTYQNLTKGLGPENAGNAQAFAKAAREASAAGERAADAEHADQLQKRITALEAIKVLNLQSAEVLGKQADSEDEVSRVGSIGIAKIRKEQEVATSQYKDALAEQILLIQEKNNLELKGVIAGQRESRAGTGGTKENPADKLAQLEEQRGGKNLVFEVEYWRNIVAETGKYHELLLRAEEEEEKLVQKMGEGSKFKEKLARDAEREDAKPTAQSTQDLQNISDYYNQTGEAYASYREEIAKGNQILAENAEKLAAVNIEIALQSGAITKVRADHALGAIKAKEYADRIAELRAQMAALKADLPQQEEQGKGGEEQAKIQELQNQIYALSGQAAAAATANQGKIAQDISQPFVQGINTINNAWLGVQNKLIFGTQNVAREFQNMGVSILESGAAWAEKWLVKQAETYVRDRVLHQINEASKLATQRAAAATAAATTSATNVAETISYTAVAAMGAAASQAPIPIVGPELAAAAAASMSALGASYASLAAFETGGIFPNTGIALVHKGEAALPRNLTNLLLQTANSSSSNSTSNSNFNQQNHFSGITDRDFKAKIRKHSAEVGHAVAREMRGGRRK